MTIDNSRNGSLLLDFRLLLIWKLVYASRDDFDHVVAIASQLCIQQYLHDNELTWHRHLDSGSSSVYGRPTSLVTAA